MALIAQWEVGMQDCGRIVIAYASTTGTRRNIAALRQAGWRLLLSPVGSITHHGMSYALDNGAWSYYQQGREFDEDAFLRALDKVGAQADWIVVPDIVQGGQRSLEYSLSWLGRLVGYRRLLLAVQDGMQSDDVRQWLNPGLGVFVGGSTDWKEQTMANWAQLAREHDAYCHVGRVNTARRIRICAAAGVDSIDGTSATRYQVTLPMLDNWRRQPDLWATQ